MNTRNEIIEKLENREVGPLGILPADQMAPRALHDPRPQTGHLFRCPIHNE